MSTVKLCGYSYGIGKGSTPACFTHNYVLSRVVGPKFAC